ncbi:hypothetical protein [Streptomyces sp. NPDC021020]|uniref:hypothetical protein n=1 Tax=Streptomyces sp. NPDC021020 TaxID=3365109 RepID=UPI003798EB3B
MIAAIVGSGRPDFEVVEMPGPDGGNGWAVVGPAVADDPVRLAELSERLHSLPIRTSPAD